MTLSSNDEIEAILKRSYLFGTLVSPLPASRLVANIGPKRVFGYALLGAGAATLLAPAAWLTPAHMVIRFSQGLFYVSKPTRKQLQKTSSSQKKNLFKIIFFREQCCLQLICLLSTGFLRLFEVVLCLGTQVSILPFLSH